jgi:MoxR-like ATPase
MPSSQSAEAELRYLQESREKVVNQLSKVIVGQQEVIDQLLICIFSRGHCLLEGVPGLAKTLLISTLAKTMSLSFSRIQFTPDLMPADITGTEIIEEDKATGTRDRRFMEGPLFANVVLADEINRTPPKTQAALLEAMQERQITVGRQRHKLSDPFFVLATQNPIEQEGTYPLPEAQQDRFMLKVLVDYPTFKDEFEVARRTTGLLDESVEAVLSGPDILRLQQTVRQIEVSDNVIRYALAIVRQTRVKQDGAPDFVLEQVGWGAGPRAVQYLILGGKARAAMMGRSHVDPEDIKFLAKPVLRHRLLVNFAAESDGITTDDVVSRIIDCTPTAQDELLRDARFQRIFAS